MEYEIQPCVENDAEFIEERADEASDAIAPPEPGAEEERFVFKIRDADGNILGGCWLGIDTWKSAAIYDLWVEPEYRRRGMASALIHAAERKARERRCPLMMVGTFDFQARPLYEKHGYTLVDTMPDFPKGHQHYLLIKRLGLSSKENESDDSCGFEVVPGDENDAEHLCEKLNAHDAACVPRAHKYVPLGKKVTDGDGKIIAGFIGGVNGWNGADIDALWVDEPYQRQGIGSVLLRAAEREAKENGAYLMILDAFEWNVDFYKKNGYEVTGVLEGFPEGHTMYCIQKYL